MEKEEQKEVTKVCKKCGKELPLEKFFKNPKMADGYLNKCKICMGEEHAEKMKDYEYAEKRREVCRRIYREKKNNKKKKDKSRDAHQAITYVKKHFEMPLGFIVHHWNYNHIYDVFIIDRRSHAIIHHKITFDKESRCFLYNGELLDTKEKHEMAIRKILGLTNEEQIIKFKKE